MTTYEKLYNHAKEHEQEHIFNFWEELNEIEQEKLLKQINEIDFKFLNELYNNKTQKTKEKDYSKITPPKTIIKNEESEINEKALEKGIEAIKNSEVALFTLAGGQGSRLGFKGPKGCFPISPIKNKTIFQIIAEKLLATQRKYDTKLNWYLMTSDATHEETIKFFKNNNYFNLDPNKIIFFKQRMLPQLDDNGKLLLSKKHEILQGPDGTGGIYNALMDNNITQDMKNKGIKQFMLITVDNPLATGIDPMYLGHHILNDSEYSVKVTKKKYPEEKVGHVVNINGINQMVEYVHLNEEQTKKRNDKNELIFSAANLLNDIINVEFVEKIEKENLLRYVAANKKANYVNNKGELVKPEKPNSHKFERFIFDALPLAKNSTVFEIIREEEFAPVKNAQGKDSPQSSKELQIKLYKSWLSQVIDDEKLLEEISALEVSPLFANDKETFIKKIQANMIGTIKKLKENEKVYFG